MEIDSNIYENDVQLLYSPEYTAVLRKIQAQTDGLLIQNGFEECLFPKLIERSHYEILERANNRFKKEWEDEAVTTAEIVVNNKKSKFMLAHWQCEPFYFFLKKNPGREFKYFDHSGWSYRLEKYYNNYKLFEFLRTEIVFCLKKQDAKIWYDELIDKIFDYLKDECKLEVRKVQKQDEKKTSSELCVIDIEALDEGNWIEIVGCHLHGDIFLNALDIYQNKQFHTGCIGIGLSRIANILFKRKQKENNN